MRKSRGEVFRFFLVSALTAALGGATGCLGKTAPRNAPAERAAQGGKRGAGLPAFTSGSDRRESGFLRSLARHEGKPAAREIQEYFRSGLGSDLEAHGLARARLRAAGEQALVILSEEYGRIPDGRRFERFLLLHAIAQLKEKPQAQTTLPSRRQLDVLNVRSVLDIRR